jgi:hypothetical protein
MDTDPSTLFAGVVVSAFGVGFFIYGKKQRRAPQLVTGVLLSVFPFFVSGALATYAIAAAIVVAMWIAIRRGF